MNIHRDALSQSEPDQIKLILDEDESHSLQYQERYYCEQMIAIKHISTDPCQKVVTKRSQQLNREALNRSRK